MIIKKFPAAVWKHEKNTKKDEIFCSNCGEKLNGKVGVCPKCNATLTNNPHILYFLASEYTCCVNCRYRKELYKEIPRECIECGWFSNRNEPYYIISPVWDSEENVPKYPECAKYSYLDKKDIKYTRTKEEFEAAPISD